MKDLESGDGEISLEMSGMIGASDHLIRMLLMDYCGDTNAPFDALMDSEFGDDYEILGEEVQEIFSGDKNRPKGQKNGQSPMTARLEAVKAMYQTLSKLL